MRLSHRRAWLKPPVAAGTDLEEFIQDQAISLREKTACLACVALAAVDRLENGVHQHTLKRLFRFIGSFKAPNSPESSSSHVHWNGFAGICSVAAPGNTRTTPVYRER